VIKMGLKRPSLFIHFLTRGFIRGKIPLISSLLKGNIEETYLLISYQEATLRNFLF